MIKLNRVIQKLSLVIISIILGTSSTWAAPESRDALAALAPGPTIVTLEEIGLSADASPIANREKLQATIDRLTSSGGAIIISPSAKPWPVASGLTLKKNVSLIGVHGPTPRGTRNTEGNGPVGSVLEIQDAEHPFITVESATQIRGIQFYYSQQELKDPAKIIPYPPTIKVSTQQSTYGVTLTNLTFYGEFHAMDFRATLPNICELILIEECYGYPLSGQFISLDYCYDIPRFLHCHVNPSIMREMNRHYSRQVVDSVVARKTFAYSIEHTDNAQLMDLFTFATWGGIHLGQETYGQLTNFNFDCVAVGILKQGSQNKNRNWQIAQGSIISNAAPDVNDNHPIIVEGKGHTALANVESFSGNNNALTNVERSKDYLLVRGTEKLTVTMTGCRMMTYEAEEPITMNNPKAIVQAVACIDKNENLYNKTLEGKPQP